MHTLYTCTHAEKGGRKKEWEREREGERICQIKQSSGLGTNNRKLSEFYDHAQVFETL